MISALKHVACMTEALNNTGSNIEGSKGSIHPDLTSAFVDTSMYRGGGGGCLVGCELARGGVGAATCGAHHLDWQRKGGG